MKKYYRIISIIIIVITISFILDLVCIYTINKPLFAIKNKDDSVNQIYKGLVYDTYICHEHSVPQIKLKGTKYTCAYINNIETELKNVSISISDISLTGATITIKDTNKNPYTYGSWYKLEKETNGKWYEVKAITDNYGFNEIGYIPDKNHEVKFIIDWSELYGELPLGHYRILKQANNQYIGIDFNIASTSDKRIEIVKPDLINLNKFNKYIEIENRIIYISPSIKEIYYIEKDTKIDLKDHLSKTYQTLDDALKTITDLLTLSGELNDGGTKIYKSKESDITIVKCNTIYKNKNIYIGDYSMNFDSNSMCR